MTKEFKRVIWEWLPGVVAGLMPMLVFFLVKSLAIPNGTLLPDQIAAQSHQFWQSLTEHLIVFSIVTSCVSTFTSFPRLFTFSIEDEPIGRASLGLVMLMTLILVFSVAMYALHEAHVIGPMAIIVAGTVVLVTLATSLYIELAIANLRLARKSRPDVA